MNTWVVVEGQGAFVRVRNPAYWVYVVTVGAGVFTLGRLFSGAIELLSTALIVPVALNAALAAVFIAVLGRMDLFEREPPSVRAAAFLWGAVAATALSIHANLSMQSVITTLFGVEFTTRWGAALTAPLNEEWIKALGVVLLVMIVREHFHRAMDGLIYGALIGLGFQVVENLIYAVTSGLANPNSDAAGTVWISVLRILIAGPWSHPVYTGVAGLGIAYALTMKGYRSTAKRYITAATLFVLAILMHFLWNVPPPSGIPDLANTALLYGKGAVILVFFIILYRHAARYEWRWFTRIMSSQPESIITDDELRSMRSLRTRHTARKTAGKQFGPHGKRLCAALQRAQLRLGEALARAERSGADRYTSLEVAAAEMSVRSIRYELTKVQDHLTPS